METTGDVAIGLDVGSTTVKAIVVDPASRNVLDTAYRRHETRQVEVACGMLEALVARFGASSCRRLFLTGSGSRALTRELGGRYVQEVNAIALAVERCHPDVNAVIELGGQDAKIIVWGVDPRTGARRRFSSMNDRCAGGTGAVIDKLSAKLGLDESALGRTRYDPLRLHTVAGRCGVFAETDIVGLQKQGVPADELLASLCDAIVQQNLRVLTRGQILRPVVLLLGGPNRFLPALQAAWRANLAAHWRERAVELSADADPEHLAVVPDRALFFPALGAVLHGLEEAAPAEFQHAAVRRALAGGGRLAAEDGGRGLVADEAAAEEFQRRYAVPSRAPAAFPRGRAVEAWIGLDAGSTSTKAALLDAGGRVLATAYRLSAGNPLEDSRGVLGALRATVEGAGAQLSVAGLGVTGYAKDLITEVIGADVAVVETVAHAQSAARLWPEVDVVCDVGGQDIKILFLRGGRIWDFRLNTQCSAGNGYFLQATAERFGIPVEAFAPAAFAARRAPAFHTGCAVFLETDIVNAQQLGWTREEILAGLARVLPKNIWLYVVQEPNLARYGRRFLLQGGTQRNAAALKAQVDFILERVPGAEVRIHDHPGECGAIGAALEALRATPGGQSRFIGFAALARLGIEVRRDESTRCRYCKNACLRIFIRALAPDGAERRSIIATCERGAEDDPARVREAHRRLRQAAQRAPNLVELAARRAFCSFAPAPAPRPAAWRLPRSRRHAGVRARLRIGLPRVLNFYSVAPFFTAYLESLGVPFDHLVVSDPTSETLFREGSRRGAVDPCFPAKVSLAHVHHLVHGKRVDVVFFPRLVSLPTLVGDARDAMSCPTVAAAPDVVRAALTREPDLLVASGVELLSPTLHMGERGLFTRQLFEAWRERLGLSPAEHAHAVREGWAALERFHAELQAEGDRVLARVEAEGGLAVVVLGRPYHHDPGVHHLIVEEIHRLGYPVLPIEALPPRGEAPSVGDVWEHSYSENSNRKVWAAKYIARHPSLVAVDLSSFKCGHDATIFDRVERILEASGTPYFAFHDLDENRPAGSIRIRIETLAYFLRRHAERLGHAEPAASEVAGRA